MTSFPDTRSIRGAVVAELDRGDAAVAFELLRPVADALAAETGAEFRELIERLPVEVWHRDPMIAAALGQSYRGPDAVRGAAGLAYFSAAEDAIAGTPETPRHCLAAVLVGHAGALRSVGRLEAARAKLDEADAIVDDGLAGPLPAVMEVRARCALERGVLELHAGRHDASRDHLLTARGLTAHLGRAGSAEALGALAVLEFGFADARTAEELALEARALVADTALARSGFAAPGYAAEMMLAIDRTQAEHAAAIEPELIAAANGTEWEPYARLVSGALRAIRRRPVEALDLLGEADREFRRWDVAGFGRDYTALVRASQLGALGRGDEAWEILAALRPYEHHVLCSGHYLAAQLLAGGDLHGADATLRDCEALGDGHAQRSALHVRLLRAAIADRLGDGATSALNVDLAFVGMARSGSRAPLRSVPPAMLARLVTSALQREQSPEVRRILTEAGRATDGAQQVIEPLSRRERLVLAEAERGATVAAIAAAMYISPNTVKTHLRRVYHKLGVSTREEAIRRARTLGLHELASREITRDSPATDVAPDDDAHA
ncbi:LuxR C-terminal-related transcriptional regulator [Pseudolysinimonas sp.]|uniref:LuxR C-terminal-related transcriptional regulator n=1 Tax=Pseudolysinimonas sp. TaxID=2680009 RepID=UPI003F81D140